MTNPNRFRRGDAPAPPTTGRVSVKASDLVTVGGVALPPAWGRFVEEYVVRFNASEAARRAGQTEASASQHGSTLLGYPKVREALRNLLVERQLRSRHDADEVSRYWWALATADARELSGVHYVPCRYCHGVDHDYQFTDVEQRDRERKYHEDVASYQRAVERQRRDHPDAELPEAPLFFEAGGGGYTTNREPMRGPDWAEKVARYFASIERPVPEGLAANADHSCPACHGDGLRTEWFADTSHLNPGAAMLFNGVRRTKDGIEVRVRDRDAAMDRFADLTGMKGPLRVSLSADASQLTDEQLATELSRRGVVIDVEYEVVGERPDDPARRFPGLPRPDLLRLR